MRIRRTLSGSSGLSDAVDFTGLFICEASRPAFGFFLLVNLCISYELMLQPVILEDIDYA